MNYKVEIRLKRIQTLSQVNHGSQRLKYCTVEANMKRLDMLGVAEIRNINKEYSNSYLFTTVGVARLIN